MECLVCSETIAISGFLDLFSLRSPKLCHRCRPNLRPGSDKAIFQDSPWLRDVISRLDKGDLVLLEVLRGEMYKTLLGRLKVGEVVVASLEGPKSSHWLPALLDNLPRKTCRKDLKQLTVSIDNTETDFTIF